MCASCLEEKGAWRENYLGSKCEFVKGSVASSGGCSKGV